MRIILSNPRGFCAGVEMAIETVERALQIYGNPLFVFHEIIHNTHVVRDFRGRGVIFVEDISKVPLGSTIIFSAHGVSPQVREQAASRQLRVIDATCPLVAKVHAEARRFAREGYYIVLIGHAGHDEIEGIFGEAPRSIQIISSVNEVAKLSYPIDARIAYLTQTTLSVDETASIIGALRRRYPQITFPRKEDICYATQNRQDAVRRLAPKVDVVVVVGSSNSSNSNRLREVAEATGTRTHFVDDHHTVQTSWFTGDETVLVTAGASAPEFTVTKIVDQLVKHYNAAVVEEQRIREREPFLLPKEVRLEERNLKQGKNDSCTAKAAISVT